MTRMCCTCKKELALGNFSLSNLNRQWYRCRACVRAKNQLKYRADPEKYRKASREWARANPDYCRERDRKRNLKRNFGLDDSTYTKILKFQNGRCAICGTDKPGGRGNRLHVDHCHQSGRIRGLLCFRCNQAIGQFQENTSSLERAVMYVRGELPTYDDSLVVSLSKKRPYKRVT